MQTHETIQLWLTERALPAALIVALFALMIILVSLLTRPRKVRAGNVWGENEYFFVNSMLIHGFDPTITRTTFRYFQEKQSTGLPIESTDKLDANLGLGPADIERSVQELLRLNSRLYKPDVTHAPLATVEDLVSLIQASPRLSVAAA